MHFCFHKRLSKGEDGLVFHSLSSQTEPDPTNPWGNDSSIVRLFHLWPLYLFQSLVDRLGGIQLGVYQRLCFLPRHPCRCLLSCGVRLGVENKKTVKTNPGGTTPSCEGYAPHSGSEFDLTAFMLRVPRLCICLNSINTFRDVSITLKIHCFSLTQFHHLAHHSKQTVLQVQVVCVPSDLIGHRPW